MTYQLHCFAQSGNAYKAALMLELCGADWEPVSVDFFNGEARSDDYRALNEMAEVPTLVHGETRLTQSGVILDYLSGKFGKFAPASEADRLEVLRWTLWDNHKLTANIATGRFLQLFLPEDKRNGDVIGFLMGRAKAALAVLEARLEGRDWIVGDGPTTADISCVGYMYFLSEIDVTPGPNTQGWMDRIAALPGWKHPYDLMPGHPLDGA